jgi:N-acetylmuramoyl-L-alanine amidase
LDVARVAAGICAAADITVSMTREREETVDWPERKVICDRCDLVISVHHNTWTDPGSSGLELFHWPGNDTVRKVCESADLDHTPSALCTVWFGVKKANDDYPGAKFICGYYAAPVIVLECCYLTNEHDLAFTRSYKYPELMGLFVANLALTYERAVHV